ncbi:MAG: phosphoenolpyruvate carboxykinase (ATP) [Candidatus Microgenomates bacterium]
MLFGDEYHNLSPQTLAKRALLKHEVISTKTGGLVLYTGRFTGRSPTDKFIVDSPTVHRKINWGKNNQPIEEKYFDNLYQKMTDFINSQNEVYTVDCLVGASKKHQIKLRCYFQYAHQALFANYLFRQPEKKDLKNFSPDLTLFAAPSVFADPAVDGTNSQTFIVLNLDKKIILIGGTKYLGEIKKSVFTYMNYILPENNVLPMHCSANADKNTGETALFFGLSGTGKTTLSADPQRALIGDDEHGWDEDGVFNFEGGCYAKCIGLKKDSEPQIWQAVHRKNVILENVALNDDGSINFESKKYTENTRAAYPLKFIKNAKISGQGKHPKYIIFLTADASGVLPPVAKLDLNQAAYHFLSGYTSKLAGTERGIVEPRPTFSAFFGSPFMPQKPMIYLNLLKNYIKKHNTKVYLINTGWIGGEYGVGHRIPIKDTRAIITAILKGQLDKVNYRHDKIFNLNIPKTVPDVNPNILNPSFSWTNKTYYEKQAKKLANLFIENIKNYPSVETQIINAGPKL